MNSNKTNNSIKRVIAVNIIVTLLLLFVIESIAAIAWYQTKKADYDAPLAAVDILRFILKLPNKKTNPKEVKFSILLEKRKQGENIYPAFTFDPELLLDQSIYHLAHPTESTILYCNENDYWTFFKTDEIGFRNPSGQIGNKVDYIFIGDSFTEGACVNNDETFAGIFRKNGYSVLNLGRAGTGPLFQLATLREYGKAVKAKKLLWFVFTGNDLKNLRAEKITRLIRYMEDDHFSQDLFNNKENNSRLLKKFIDKKISYQSSRRQQSLPLVNYVYARGKSLNEYEAQNFESIMIIDIAKKIHLTAKQLGMELEIVIIGHNFPVYSQEIQKITQNAIIKFSKLANIPYLLVSKEDIEKNQSQWFSKGKPHFNAYGYRQVAERIIADLKNHPQL